MVSGEQLREALQKYMPPEAVNTCADWIKQYRIRVRIKRSRLSKYGDYHPPHEGSGHTITINYDLNRYAFLITFTHEVAHLTCFLKHRDRVSPHGDEWKKEFRNLLHPFIQEGIFPYDIQDALTNYIQSPAASTCSDEKLMRCLRLYDPREEGWLSLEELPHQSAFILRNGQKFEKGRKLRKNFECYELDTRHKYHMHPMIDVLPII